MGPRCPRPTRSHRPANTHHSTPVLLALLGGGNSVFAAHLITGGCLIGTLFALRAYYSGIGIASTPAMLLMVCYALLPVIRGEALELAQRAALSVGRHGCAMRDSAPGARAAYRFRVALDGRGDGSGLADPHRRDRIAVPLAIAALRRRSAALLLPLAIVVLVWPYPAAAQRLLLMLIPILLAQAYLAMAALSARYAPRLAKLAPSLVVYGPLLLALPDAVRAAVRFIAPAAVDLVPFKHTDSWYLDDPHDIKDVSAWALVRWKPAAAASANQP